MTENSKQKESLLTVRVTPNSGRNEITGRCNNILYIKIAASPEKGKANKELIEFLSRTLGVKKSAIVIVRGETSRHKVVEIEGMSREDILKYLKI